MRRYISLFVSMTLALSFPAFGSTKEDGQAVARVSASRATLLTPNNKGLNPVTSLKLAQKEITEENKRLKYSIKVKYPQLEGMQSGSATNFNAAVKALMMREVAKFRKEMRGWDATGASPEVGSYLEIEYEVLTESDRLISIAFGEGSYYRGAAHPNHNALVINYDMKANRTLRLAELFKPRSNYLSVISNYCIADLKKQMGADADDRWIKEGAAATLKNYKNWIITKGGLMILFDPYQVAPYAAGPQRVEIPYAALKTIITSAGPLASTAK